MKKRMDRMPMMTRRTTRQHTLARNRDKRSNNASHLRRRTVACLRRFVLCTRRAAFCSLRRATQLTQSFSEHKSSHYTSRCAVFWRGEGGDGPLHVVDTFSRAQCFFFSERVFFQMFEMWDIIFFSFSSQTQMAQEFCLRCILFRIFLGHNNNKRLG